MSNYCVQGINIHRKNERIELVLSEVLIYVCVQILQVIYSNLSHALIQNGQVKAANFCNEVLVQQNICYLQIV